MPGTVLRTLPALAHANSYNSSEISTISGPIFEMRKLRYTETKHLIQYLGHHVCVCVYIHNRARLNKYLSTKYMTR